MHSYSNSYISRAGLAGLFICSVRIVQGCICNTTPMPCRGGAEQDQQRRQLAGLGPPGARAAQAGTAVTVSVAVSVEENNAVRHSQPPYVTLYPRWG